jgi:hypothetical protein
MSPGETTRARVAIAHGHSLHFALYSFFDPLAVPTAAATTTAVCIVPRSFSLQVEIAWKH